MIIKFENVSKQYPDGSHALEEIDFEIPPGDFVFLVGPSGAGKTTLLRLLTRELMPSSGKIKVDSIDITTLPKSKLPQLRRQIGTVFQDFKLLLDRTVAENVGITLEVLGKKDKEIERSVSTVLKEVGILGKANFFPAQLSGGEVQRTAIARAIVSNPKILLADEPTGDLDPENAEALVELLEKISKDLGTIIVMATHNERIVNSAKKRVIHLEKGRVVRDEKEGKYAKD